MSANIQQQLKEMRTLVQEMGWEEFMSHVGSLMAEQSDKISGDQSTALFNSAAAIHATNEIWKKCGRFEYPNDMVYSR